MRIAIIIVSVLVVGLLTVGACLLATGPKKATPKEQIELIRRASKWDRGAHRDVCPPVSIEMDNTFPFQHRNLAKTTIRNMHKQLDTKWVVWGTAQPGRAHIILRNATPTELQSGHCQER